MNRKRLGTRYLRQRAVWSVPLGSLCRLEFSASSQESRLFQWRQWLDSQCDRGTGPAEEWLCCPHVPFRKGLPLLQGSRLGSLGPLDDF